VKPQITHIINPFIPPAGSDLEYAQPITFETIRIAAENAKNLMNIEVIATCFEEDIHIIPSFITTASTLKRSVLDVGHFEKKVKLPFLADILEKAYNESTSDYIIYSNIDIGLYPDFYIRLYELLQKGHDALIINRKRIEPEYTDVNDLEKIWKQKGKSHPGFDCFVFHRSLYPKFILENICIGVPFIEISFSQNLFHLANKFKLVETDNYTFHIGMEIFKKRAPKEYYRFNRSEYKKVIKKIEPFLDQKNLPYSNRILPLRLIKQGLHPCIPIKLALKLEWKKLTNHI